MFRFAGRNRAVQCASALCRRASDVQEPGTVEGIKEMLQKAEQDQIERELAVDSRQVIFASASSVDHRPRIAAAEAFDIAAAALPRPPNFCYMNVSLDYAAMVDAPEVVWFNMCKTNDVTPSTVKPQTLHMMGGAVCAQRLGGGYIQMILGCIPDLQTDSFTFDAVPTAAEIHRADSPPPVACLASLDTRLSVQYERVLSSHLSTLKGRLGADCPLVGGVYPAVEDQGRGKSEPGDSIFFVNDRVYKGSAAAVILRSNLLQAKEVSCVPSICIAAATIDEMSNSGDGTITITKMNGEAAFDYINKAYQMGDLKGKPCRICLGVPHKNVRIPVNFVGDPERRLLQLFLPTGVELNRGESVDLLVDDVELDIETAAGLLISLEKSMAPLSAEKDITIAREARRNIIASSTFGLHFSYPGLNIMAKPDIPVISLGNSSAHFSPTILQRCVGRRIPNSGIFASGQVATVGDVTGIFTRSSTYCLFQGTS